MIISASIQAADQLNILQSIEKHSSKFDQIHVDITDGHFTDNISMSFNHIKEIKKQTNYKVDVQLMVEDNVKLAPIAYKNGADMVSIHLESTPINDFINKSYNNVTIEINGKSNMEDLKNLLNDIGETKVQIKVKRNSKIYIFSLKNPRKFNFNIFNTLKSKEYIKKISF